jgi:hypothetical protein
MTWLGLVRVAARRAALAPTMTATVAPMLLLLVPMAATMAIRVQATQAGRRPSIRRAVM